MLKCTRCCIGPRPRRQAVWWIRPAASRVGSLGNRMARIVPAGATSFVGTAIGSAWNSYCIRTTRSTTKSLRMGVLTKRRRVSSTATFARMVCPGRWGQLRAGGPASGGSCGAFGRGSQLRAGGARIRSPAAGTALSGTGCNRRFNSIGWHSRISRGSRRWPCQTDPSHPNQGMGSLVSREGDLGQSDHDRDNDAR